MWLLLRLSILLAMLFRRRLRDLFPRSAAGIIDGQPYFLRLRRNRRRYDDVEERSINRFQVGIDLPVPVAFAFTRENDIDRFFTRIGLAEEFQTGDGAFDRHIYIASDHPALHAQLRADAGLRRLIQQAVTMGYTRITGDGTTLWLTRPAVDVPTPADLRLLADLRASLLTLRRSAWLSTDPFTTRVLVIEGLIWSLAGYVLGALVDPLAADFHHLDAGALGGMGIGVSVCLFFILVGVTFQLLRGSSQGHRVILESALVLGLSLPFAGPLLVSDLNRHLDLRPATPVSRTIASTEMKQEYRRNTSRGTWGCRRRLHTTYLIRCADPGNMSGIRLPLTIEVPRETYAVAAEGRTLVIQVHRGALGLPWYSDLSVR